MPDTNRVPLVPNPPRIWRVSAHSQTDWYGAVEPDQGDMYEVLCEYFSTYEKAHAYYARGDRSLGIREGLHWHLESFLIDSPWAEDEYIGLKELVTPPDDDDTLENGEGRPR